MVQGFEGIHKNERSMTGEIWSIVFVYIKEDNVNAFRNTEDIIDKVKKL